MRNVSTTNEANTDAATLNSAQTVLSSRRKQPQTPKSKRTAKPSGHLTHPTSNRIGEPAKNLPSLTVARVAAGNTPDVARNRTAAIMQCWHLANAGTVTSIMAFGKPGIFAFAKGRPQESIIIDNTAASDIWNQAGTKAWIQKHQYDCQPLPIMNCL